MSSYQQTIIVELGSSRIKVGFAGETKPRRVLNGVVWDTDDCSWHIPISDGMGARPCNWGKLFQYASTNGSAPSLTHRVSSVYEWEESLYPLFSHVLTSILFVQRPSRHRILILMNDIYPPRNLREALSNVILNYIGIGRLLLVNGGGFATMSYLLDGLPRSINAKSRTKAHLLVDIGTYEARVVVSVSGSSILENTFQTSMSGYHSFLTQILHNYRADAQSDKEKAKEIDTESTVTTLHDANAIVQAWLQISRTSIDISVISVNLPSLASDSSQTSTQIPIEPLQQAFYQVYLDYTNPSSLIYTMLTSALVCPIDYRRIALQNVLLLGGGSTVLQYFNSANDGDGFGHSLMKAAQEACGAKDETEKSEEKKDDDARAISSIAKQRFKCLKASVLSCVDVNGEQKYGMRCSYPDPFAADVASWIGGSIMGSLDLKNEEWMTKSSASN